jgi:predicted N-acetyltransferase YhbS
VSLQALIDLPLRDQTMTAIMTADVTFADEPDLSVDEFIGVLRRSTLAERRPVDEPARVRRMLAHANIMLCARDENGTLIGISRALTDFSFCCYLSDLAVDVAWQRRGIGYELIRRTHERAGHGTSLILLSVPGAMGAYARLGMEPCDNAFIIPSRT